MKSKAELLEWYRGLWLFQSDRQKKNYMLDISLEEPGPIDTALAQSGYNIDRAVKKIHPTQAPTPPCTEPPVRRELNVTAGLKRERSWPKESPSRKQSAPRPSSATKSFGLLDSGISIQPKIAVAELISSPEPDLITKLLNGKLSSDSSEPENPPISEPVPPSDELPDNPLQQEDSEDNLFDGGAVDSPPQPETDNGMLEESSSSSDSPEPEEPAKNAQGHYTFKGFSSTLKPKEKPAGEVNGQQKLKTKRIKRETSRPKRLYTEMLDKLELADNGMRFVEKGTSASRQAKADDAETVNQVPVSSGVAVQRIPMASEINERLMTGVKFRMARLQDSKLYKRFEAMARVAISYAAVTHLKEELPFNTDPVDEFHKALSALLKPYMLGDRPLSEVREALQQRLDYKEDNNPESKLAKCAWLARFTCWAYKDMLYQEDSRPGSDFVRLSFSAPIIPGLVGSQPVMHCRRADMTNISVMRGAFWPLQMLVSRALDMVVNLQQAEKEKLSAVEIISILSEKQQDMQSSFIRWSNAVRLIGCEKYVFEEN
jgi:hypothetical protein